MCAYYKVIKKLKFPLSKYYLKKKNKQSYLTLILRIIYWWTLFCLIKETIVSLNLIIFQNGTNCELMDLIYIHIHTQSDNAAFVFRWSITNEIPEGPSENRSSSHFVPGMKIKNRSASASFALNRRSMAHIQCLIAFIN